MAGLNVKHRRFLVVRKNGQKIRLPIRTVAEPPATVYFGVRFKDGTAVFMPRRIRTADGASRDLAKLRAYACRLVRKKDTEIASVAQACVKCARSIPGCTGCSFGAAIQEEATAKSAVSAASNEAAKPATARPTGQK